MKVLIIPEDQTHDGFILQPIVEAIFESLAIPARVGVLPEPRLRGASYALDAEIIRSIVADNPMVELFLLLVDRDCDRQRHVDKAAARVAEHEGRLLACLAKQEVEVWMLALHRGQLSASWAEIRAHCDPKEAYADPLLASLGTDGPGGGRKKAMRALSGNLRTLLSLCEELDSLKATLSGWHAARAARA